MKVVPEIQGNEWGVEGGVCALCMEEEVGGHLCLKCIEMQRWREKVVNSKININEERGHKKLINCTMTTELRNAGKFLWKINIMGKPNKEIRINH